MLQSDTIGKASNAAPAEDFSSGRSLLVSAKARAGAGPERRIETYLTSIDRIEELTGLDFLTNLPESMQEVIESVVATRPW